MSQLSGGSHDDAGKSCRGYVLEISSSLAQGAPGCLLRFRSPTSAPEVVASGLLGGNGLACSARQKAIFITEAFPGRITKIAL